MYSSLLILLLTSLALDEFKRLKATDEGLAEEFDIYRCETSDCKNELDILGVESPVVVAPLWTMAVDTPAAATAVTEVVESTGAASAGSGVRERWMRMMARPMGTPEE